MKLELPLAFGLLAFGCWLFLGTRISTPNPAPKDAQIRQKPESNQSSSSHSGSETGTYRRSDGTHSPGTTLRSSVVQAASIEEFDSASASQPVAPPHSPRRQAEKLLVAAIERIEHGPAIVAKSRLKVKMFGATLNSEGTCYLAGQGSGKTRFDFQFEGDNGTTSIHQICDGRFFFQVTHEPPHDELPAVKPNIRFIDLERVAKSGKTQSRSSPATWLATGGVPGLLRSLMQDFEFDAIEQVELGGVPMKQLQGTWKKKRLIEDLEGTVPSRLLTPTPDWEKLPSHLPQHVSIYLGADQFLPNFPYRIRFLRENKFGEVETEIHLELFEVTKNPSLDPKLFEMNLAGTQYNDLTERMVGRLIEFEKRKSEKSPNKE